MMTLIYCTFEMPSNTIKKIYKAMLENDIPHEVKQNPVNNSVYTIECRETKKTYPILKELGFK